jgi:hypothetical protein
MGLENIGNSPIEALHHAIGFRRSGLGQAVPMLAALASKIAHRLHDPPSWGRCPLQAPPSRWDHRALTVKAPNQSENRPSQNGATVRLDRNFYTLSGVSAWVGFI